MQVAYCEEQVECRRVILLSHFGETNFTAAGCHKTCDVCQRNEGAAFENKDMTQVARDMIQVSAGHVMAVSHATNDVAICSLTRF